jgi:hypothetical protein
MNRDAKYRQRQYKIYKCNMEFVLSFFYSFQDKKKKKISVDPYNSYFLFSSLDKWVNMESEREKKKVSDL